MEEYLSVSVIPLEDRPSQEAVSAVYERLMKMEGVNNVALQESGIRIEYCRQILSIDRIKEEIIDSGCCITAAVEKKKNPLERFLERMADSNRKQFGGKKLDCCKLNDPRDR